ncbi:MAG TPA: cation:proton antiporter [Gemmatimonadota bacterium]|nr:cation:proton antiporter [Gemmatimonadota bacterium]
MSSSLLVQEMAIVIAVGILAQVVAERLRQPAIVFLLLFGILVGPDVLGWVDPSDLGLGLEAIVSLAIALILFEGGLQLHLVDLAAVGRVVRNLVTIGAATTVVGAALAARFVLGFDWTFAILFGAIVSVTGPTVINPLLDRIRVKRRVDTILRAEGILIDPVGAILAVIVLEFFLTTDTSVWEGFLGFAERVLVGGAMGFAGGWALGRALRLGRLVTDELVNLVVLGWVLGLFAVSQAISPESGILAAVIAGMTVRRGAMRQERLVRRFKGQLSILFISILFILLSAYLPLRTIASVGWGGVVVVLLLMWVVRPLGVALSTVRSETSWRERLFVMWVCPRGVVAISIASFIALLARGGSAEVVRAGITPPEGEALLALVFLTIAITVLVQGLSARAVGRALRVLADTSHRVVIVGANELGRVLARVLSDVGLEPTLVDTNPHRVSLARAEGFPAVVGNCLERSVMESAGADGAVALVATTANQEINFLVAQRAREEFFIPEVYPALVETSRGAHEGLVEGIGAAVAFGGEIPVREWDHDIRVGRAAVVERTIPEAVRSRKLAELDLPDGIVPLVIVRGDRPTLARSDQYLQPKDVVLFLVDKNGETGLDDFLRSEAEISGVVESGAVGGPYGDATP